VLVALAALLVAGRADGSTARRREAR